MLLGVGADFFVGGEILFMRSWCRTENTSEYKLQLNNSFTVKHALSIYGALCHIAA